MSASTPFAEAVSMQRAGATPLAIRDRLRALGLDDEAVALLLNALGSRGSDAPAPEAEWGPTPAPVTEAKTTSVAPADAPAMATTCTRCGVFLSPATSELVLGKSYCTACAARPDVNYPRAYRDQHWGKRDGWAWFFGALSPLLLLAGTLQFIQGEPSTGLLVMATGISWLIFWTGARVGRGALVASTAVGAVYNVVNGIPPNVIGLVLVVLAMTDTRTRLFFELDVPEADLAKAWLKQHGNRFAQWARRFGVSSLLSVLAWIATRWAASATIFFGLVAVVLGVIGLRTVNEQAQPPVGGRSTAIWGLACGAIGVLVGPLGLMFALNVL